jgi:hypothetical protein
MKIYLCAMYARLEWLQPFRREIEACGHECTAQWLTTDDQQCPADGAAMDVEDVRRSDAIICFTEHPSVGYTTGGRWVEFGIALALGIPIYIVGPPENVFCHLSHIHVYQYFPDALQDAIAEFNAKDALDEKSERLDAAIVSDVKHVFGHGLKVMAMASIVSVMLIGIITALLTYYTLKTNALELRGLQEINRQ